MRTAIYVRCSTKYHNQDVENQLLQLNTFCERQNYEIYKVYSDYDSGASENRLAFKEMFLDASKRKFDLLLFWSLDRFSREGVSQTIYRLQTLEGYGISYKLLQNKGLMVAEFDKGHFGMTIHPTEFKIGDTINFESVWSLQLKQKCIKNITVNGNEIRLKRPDTVNLGIQVFLA